VIFIKIIEKRNNEFNNCSLCDCNVVEDLCHFLLLCPALEKVRRPLLNNISFNTHEENFYSIVIINYGEV
jgi:hypothetical protein